MNEFKRTLAKQLGTLSLSEEKKQEIARKARHPHMSSDSKGQWGYRFVLSFATLLGIGILLPLRNRDIVQQKENHAATEQLDIVSLLIAEDWLKFGLIMIGFILIYVGLARRQRVKHWELPHCVYCLEDWTYRQSLKQSWQGYQGKCPHCGERQYRTKKSLRSSQLMDIALLFTIIVTFAFQNGWLGAGTYLIGLTFLQSRFDPYTIAFQKDKTYPSKVLKIIQLFALIIVLIFMTIMMQMEENLELNEAVMEEFPNAILLPISFDENKNATYFLFENDLLIGYATAKKTFFGGTSVVFSMGMTGLDVLDEQLSLNGVREGHFVYGLFKNPGRFDVQVNGEMSIRYPLDLILDAPYEDENVAVWWYEVKDNDDPINVQLVDYESGELIESLEL